MERQYKDSGIEWIGRIPKEWETVRLKSLFTERNERECTGKTLLSVSQYFGIRPKSETDLADSHIAESYDDYKEVHKGDFVMNIMLAWNGSYAVSEYDGIVSPAYCVFKFRKDCCNKYFHYLLRTEGYPTAFKTMSRGVIDSRLRLYPEQFYTFPVVIPPLPEQQRIASYLDKKCGEIDALIALQEKMIAQLTEYKQAVITEAVTKGLDPNAKLVPSGIEWIGDVPEGWKVCKLKNVFIVSDGTHDTPNYVEKSNDSYPLVTSKCIVDGEICVDLANHISKADYLLINERSYHRKYDVIMPMIGTVGNPAIVMTNEEYALKNVAIFRTGGKYNKAALLKYFINSSVFTEQLNYKKRGGVQNFVSQDILNNLILIMPNNLEEIIAYLDTKCSEIDSLIALKRQKIESLNAYKKSVIYEAVTGKTMI